MKHAALALALALSALPAHAQDGEGPGLMQRGLQLFFEGLRQEVEPAMRDLQDLAQEMEPAMRSFVEQMGPALRDLMGEIEDWSAYHPPERLPNGDIILRRKTPEERDAPAPADPMQTPREIDI